MFKEKEQAKGRSFSSFNTPENIRWEREWDKAFPKPPGAVTYRDQLPAHYSRIGTPLCPGCNKCRLPTQPGKSYQQFDYQIKKEQEKQ